MLKYLETPFAGSPGVSFNIMHAGEFQGCCYSYTA